MSKSACCMYIAIIICFFVSCSKESNDKRADDIVLKCSKYIMPEDILKEDVNTEIQFLYGSCELNEKKINIYRNNDNELVIATPMIDEDSIIAVYSQWQSNDYVSFEERIKKGTAPNVTTNLSNLFSQEAVMIELPTGANTNIYFILVSNGVDIEPVFYTIGRGLEVGNIDYDQEEELISVLEGYFYDWQDNQVYLIETVLSTNVRQLVWEGDERGLVVYFANGVAQSGKIDTLNLQLNYDK